MRQVICLQEIFTNISDYTCDSVFSLFVDTGKMQHENSSPSHVRSMFREGKLNNCPTTGMCGTFLQANVAIVHEDYAGDFRKFVDLNSAPCPLIYQSKVGEVEGSFLAKDSDIRYG